MGAPYEPKQISTKRGIGEGCRDAHWRSLGGTQSPSTTPT